MYSKTLFTLTTWYGLYTARANTTRNFSVRCSLSLSFSLFDESSLNHPIFLVWFVIAMEYETWLSYYTVAHTAVYTSLRMEDKVRKYLVVMEIIVNQQLHKYVYNYISMKVTVILITNYYLYSNPYFYLIILQAFRST